MKMTLKQKILNNKVKNCEKYNKILTCLLKSHMTGAKILLSILKKMVDKGLMWHIIL